MNSSTPQRAAINPVLPGFYPDPSICRVGNDYYLVNSSFEYFPGVPLWHSRDLINWQQIGHVLDRPSQLDLTDCPCSDGIYAPTIRHHDGRFYMVTTLVQSGTYRNFFVTADDPRGPWSDPVWLDQNGIDPSLLFDADGRVFLQTNRGLTFAMERALYQSEIDPTTGRRLRGPEKIWPGTGGCYVEGPHLYRRGDWYYLLAAEGGTAYGHMVTIARSRDPWGPYESCPHNPILSNRHAYEDLHGTGHGDLIEATDGSWWMVHLAFRRTVGDVHTLGRETCLAPVTWVDDWPVVNENGTTAPTVRVPGWWGGTRVTTAQREDFDGPRLDPRWIFLRNPDPACYSLQERPGHLRLTARGDTLDTIGSPTAVFRRQQDFVFHFESELDFQPAGPDQRAGLTVFMTNEHHYDLSVTQRQGRRTAAVRVKLEAIDYVAGEFPLPETGPVRLAVSSDRTFYHFQCAPAGGPWSEPVRINTRYLATEVTGGYNGVVLGLFAEGAGAPPADFSCCEYRPD
jgi:alpha-N-arabinofuranosidase